MRVACVVSCVILSWDLSVLSSVWPWTIHAGLLAVGYIAAGYTIRKYNLLTRELPRLVWLAIGSICLICMAYGFVDIAPGIWKLGPLDVLGSFCVGFLFMRSYSRFMEWGGRPAGFGFIEKLGLNSIWLLCIHAFEKAVIPWNNLIVLFPDSPLLCSCVCFIGRVFIIMFIHRLFHMVRRMVLRRRNPKVVLTDE